MLLPAPVYFIPTVMMVVALGDMPYGYYQLLRLVACVASGLVAWEAWHARKQAWAYLFGMIALLYNPVFKIHFERGTWEIVNVATAALFVALFIARWRATGHKPPGQPE